MKVRLTVEVSGSMAEALKKEFPRGHHTGTSVRAKVSEWVADQTEREGIALMREHEIEAPPGVMIIPVRVSGPGRTFDEDFAD